MNRQRLLVAGLCLISIWGNSFSTFGLHRQVEENAERVKHNPRRYFAPYYVEGNLPNGFEDLSGFDVWMPKDMFDAYYDNPNKFERLIVPNKHGYILATGTLVTVDKGTSNGRILRSTSYEFSNSKIVVRSGQIMLSFVTKSVKGIRYEFMGRYFETGEVYPERETIRLEGLLTKYVKGVKRAEAKVRMRPEVLDID